MFSGDFIAGINTLNGIATYHIKLQYWDLFDIPELEKAPKYDSYAEDRHLNNFDIIRDVNALKWLDIAPLYDNGQSLNIKYYDEYEIHISGEGKLFYEVKSFDEIIKVVKDFSRIDTSKLDGIVEWFDDLLHEYQYLEGFSDMRINKICILLNRQVNKLKSFKENL